jgi:hypothetical protein
MRNDFADAWNHTKASWNFPGLGARRAMKNKTGDKRGSKIPDTSSEPDATSKAFHAPGRRSKPGSPAPVHPMSTISLGEQLHSNTSADLGLSERATTRRKPLRTKFSYESLVEDSGSTFKPQERLNTHAQPDHDGEMPSHTSTSNIDIPELEPAEDASAEACVSQTLDEYRTVSEKLQYESRIHQEASIQLRNLQGIEGTLRATQIDLRDTMGKLMDRDASLEAAQKDNEKRERRHLLNLRQLNGTIALQERKMSDLVRTHEAAMGARHSSLVQEIARLKSLHDQQMQQLRT